MIQHLVGDHGNGMSRMLFCAIHLEKHTHSFEPFVCFALFLEHQQPILLILFFEQKHKVAKMGKTKRRREMIMICEQ